MNSRLLLCFSFLIATMLLPCINDKPADQQAMHTPINPARRRPNILFVIMDDWSWPHAGAYGDKVVNTPAFDWVASHGLLFTNAFCVSPSCTPSRGSVLTGQTIHRLEEGGNLWSILPKKFTVYPELLEAAGYQVGYTGKGWDPGILKGSGRTRNPAGPAYNDITLAPPTPVVSDKDYAGNFEAFINSKPKDKPFCFWYGGHEPHRKYEKGMGLQQGKNPDKVQVPAFLPDLPEVRRDLLDYYAEVEWADQHLSKMITLLKETGQLDNTLIMVTGDNGLPFPRAKANLYDAGTRMPLAVCWPARIAAGGSTDTFVSFTDFAPTFLEAAGLKPLPVMTGRSFLRLLEGKTNSHRDTVFLERERHARVRPGNVGYPCRAIRTKAFLYIRNFHPERWPAGDPEKFGDVDASPTKQFILDNRNKKNIHRFYELAFAKRPAEELYDLQKDSAQLINVAGDPAYASVKQQLSKQLAHWMEQTADPRAQGGERPWDQYPYYTGEDRSKEENQYKRQ